MTVTQMLTPRVVLHTLGAEPPAPRPGYISLARLPASEQQEWVFGDGSHPTTRLCAMAMDALCWQLQPAAVLDVGTGTGVLARIARSRGAKQVWATDVDPSALSCAHRHSQLDKHAVPIHLSCLGPDLLGIGFNLVIANILEQPLRLLAPALYRCLLPRGRLVISGFTPMQAPSLRVVYERLGLQSLGQSMLDEWVALVFGRSIAGGCE